jgi:uncharacterized protein HemX
MTEQTHTSAPTVVSDDTAPTPTATASVPPTVVVQAADQATRRFHFGSFIAGFLAAVVVAALGLGVFLAVSDSDDDGNLQVDVPAVNVDIGG